MARAKGVVDFDVDEGAAGYVLGAINGMTRSVDTRHYINAVIAEAHAQLARRFDSHMRAVAASNPKGFKHVFEWGSVGVLRGKLWRHHLSGYGRRRNANYYFISSKLPIPKPTPRSTGVSQKELNKLSNRRYVFRWKASVIEFGTPVDIRPKNGKRLFVPLRGQTPQMSNDRDRERATRRGFVFAQSVHVNNPGGDATGNFTRAWFAFWAGAQELFDAELDPVLEQRLDTIATINGTAARKSRGFRSKPFHLSWKAGMAEAQAIALAQERASLAESRLEDLEEL